MDTAQLVLALLIAVAALVTIARRLRIAYPIFLVIGGLILGMVPGTPKVDIDPDLIFLFVLPPLLYLAAFFTPLRSLRANLGMIASLAVGLVLASAFAAAAAIATRLAVPRRIVTILEGESLLNDATALTLYSIAIAVAGGGTFKAS